MVRFLPSLLSLVLLGFSLFVGKTYAAETQPVPELRLPCKEDIVRDPEFHSLRPYQAAPCGDYEIALFCGNEIKIIETKNYTLRNKCVSSDDPDWSETNKPYQIDLSETQLPILGNTELVSNSQSKDDLIDDATKVNEYVSWYLNGVTNRAEYGDTKNTNYETVNLSGPIQKLLPQAITEAQRIASIASASATGSNTADEDDPNAPQSGTLTHNQIVVCYTIDFPFLPYWLTNLFGTNAKGLGKAKAEECYPGNNRPAQHSILRLTNWNETAIDAAVDAIRPFLEKILPPNILGELIGQALVDRWPKKTPPLPWADKDGQPFESEEFYRKAYNEWRGQLCAFINLPIVGRKLICAGIPGVTNNDFADLFPYVPIASTPDKLGKMPIFTVTIQGGGGTHVASSSWVKKAAPTLYYAHTQEVKDLSEFLNKSYIPQGLTNSELPASTETNDLNSTPQCRVLDVRSNPGDNLFPVKTPADIWVDVTFDVDEVPCECHPDPVTGKFSSSCHGIVNVGIQTSPNRIPNVNEIWKNTVSGNASTFRRIYPKVEEGAPVSCLADIPGVTKAVYKVVSDKTDMTGVEGPLGSPDKENMDPENAKIYFSHLGSLYDYFLKGIQTALRPKGYGEPTPISGDYCESLEDGGDCSWDMAKINAAINKAAAKYQVPESLLRAIFEIESYEIINGAATYQCVPNFAGALGVAQVVQSTYDLVTCGNEKMSDEMMCGDYGEKLSRCNFDDAFELMARVLLYNAGRFSACGTPSQGILESEVQVWYQAACNYYGTFAPDSLTIGLANDIPQASRRQNGDMNYCDIVGYKMGAFPPYP